MDAYIGEIRAFPYTFAPDGWLDCQGQTVPISQYNALYALIGTYYGPAVNNTFTLPDLRGLSAISQGTGPGFPTWYIGEKGGEKSVTLNSSNIPQHVHALGTKAITKLQATAAPADSATPVGNIEASQANGTTNQMYKNLVPDKSMLDGTAVIYGSTVPYSGGVAPHENRMPALVIRYCINYDGVFPVNPGT